ncbi:MAG: plasmid pRiA4b ORF-3 family protein [Sphingobacteriales bacterium]
MTFQFKIQLKNISKPPVWRQVSVPAQFSFYRFHLVIQEAFGWENCHLFQFSPKGFGSYPVIKEPFDDGEDDEFMDAGETKLNEIFTKESQTFNYIYDFGDSWEHKITLEKIKADKTITADCIGGKGACPPEDCGGPRGYMNLIEVLKDPANPEHEEMKEWLGIDEDDEWDVNNFNLEETSAMVRLV